ncbi:MAG: hypothetical protein D6696_06540 [Acidobacteria bacterium]|nr:MAG: hypothetical protein D6696_06540 [Acidobacteriota bacterium]
MRQLIPISLSIALLPSPPLSGQGDPQAPPAGDALPAAYYEAVEEAETLMLEQRPKEAIRVFRRADRQAGRPTLRCALGLAEAYNKVGAFKDGLTQARQAVELAADVGERVHAYNQLGIALFAQGNGSRPQLEEAVGAFRRALEISGGKANGARFSLGYVLLKLGRDDEGVALLEEYLAAGGRGAPAEQARSLIDNPLRARVDLIPDFEAVTLTGEFLTSEELRGKVVLLDFWGTWCAPCVAAVPHLRRLARRAAKHPFVVLSISNDSDEKALRSFVAQHDMDWPQIWDRRLVHDTFDVQSFPTYLLVDPEGKIIFRETGWSSRIAGELDAQVARALRRARKARAQ